MKEREKNMNYYFAPMEGVTGYVYRNAHHAIFPGIDKYFTPFVSPNQNRCFTPREKRDILPENNRGICVVPQILTNRSDYFLRTMKELAAFGYQEVNLNLGCPSGTVVSKGKGAGFLEDADKLDAFFDEVFQKADLEKMKISVKTRIGIEDAEEFEDLQKVFQRYPFAEVIVHPRVRSDFYKNQPDRQVFGAFLIESVNPVCYNGDIFTVSDAAELKAEFPELESIMCGRGLLSNPALVRELQGGETLKKEELHRFHDTLYESYRTLFAPDERSVLFKMKELWEYFITAFQGAERDVKKIKKAQHFAEYEAAVSHIFENHEVGLSTE